MASNTIVDSYGLWQNGLFHFFFFSSLVTSRVIVQELDGEKTLHLEVHNAHGSFDGRSWQSRILGSQIVHHVQSIVNGASTAID